MSFNSLEKIIWLCPNHKWFYFKEFEQCGKFKCISTKTRDSRETWVIHTHRGLIGAREISMTQKTLILYTTKITNSQTRHFYSRSWFQLWDHRGPNAQRRNREFGEDQVLGPSHRRVHQQKGHILKKGSQIFSNSNCHSYW